MLWTPCYEIKIVPIAATFNAVDIRRHPKSNGYGSYHNAVVEAPYPSKNDKKVGNKVNDKEVDDKVNNKEVDDKVNKKEVDDKVNDKEVNNKVNDKEVDDKVNYSLAEKFQVTLPLPLMMTVYPGERARDGRLKPSYN